MPTPAYPGSADRAATLRRMKFLVIVLVVSNVATGVFSYYLLRKVDERYSVLISQSVPMMSDLRELMADTVAAMRATNPRNFNGPDPAASLAAIHWRLAGAQSFRVALLRNHADAENPADRAALEKSGGEFERAASEVERLYTEGRTDEAVRFRENTLLPAFDAYIAVIGKAADGVRRQSLTASDDYTAKTNSLAAVVLGVAGWPLLLLMALLFLTVVFVLVLMLMFRGKGLGDAP